jgi:hypothetical protein
MCQLALARLRNLNIFDSDNTLISFGLSARSSETPAQLRGKILGSSSTTVGYKTLALVNDTVTFAMKRISSRGNYCPSRRGVHCRLG